jgi:hypothetical protein
MTNKMMKTQNLVQLFRRQSIEDRGVSADVEGARDWENEEQSDTGRFFAIISREPEIGSQKRREAYAG